MLTEAIESMEHRKSRDDLSFMLDGWRREFSGRIGIPV